MKQQCCVWCGTTRRGEERWDWWAAFGGNAVCCDKKCLQMAIDFLQSGRARCFRCAERINPNDGAHTSQLVRGVYCSEKCLNKAAADIAAHCPTCNKPFIGAPYVWRSADGSEYCGKECRDARANGWINVHDELPEGGKPVLVWVTGFQPLSDGARRGYRIVASSTAWETEGHFLKEKFVTHWRLLPEPPIVEQEEPAMGRCKDCCFWFVAGREYWGRCIKAAEPNALFGDSEGNELPTRRDFGCVEFVRKDA